MNNFLTLKIIIYIIFITISSLFFFYSKYRKTTKIFSICDKSIRYIEIENPNVKFKYPGKLVSIDIEYKI